MPKIFELAIQYEQDEKATEQIEENPNVNISKNSGKLPRKKNSRYENDKEVFK
ncbi:hypothetical protein [Streptococcus porcinus]|uniref:Conserved domain protein n=1 Tax=Streptococcus porcinus str. Jelinkova 176 TaxID=873448 RepID=A0ABN0CXL0_STRPO|nr:hypothetical protein [Streptococcus porcinus]EGJ28022.1 conserved domain protein [Streptococcus porcinus str. Jelinkova 176]